MVPRVLYELGLLTVKQVHKDHTITLGSPNTDVCRRGVEVMSSKTVLTAPPPKEDVLKLLTLQNLQKVMDKAAEEINYSYFGFGNKLREYAIQDAIFRQLQVLFPPLNKKTSDFSSYQLDKEHPVMQIGKSSKGFVDFAFFDGHGNYYLFEVKKTNVSQHLDETSMETALQDALDKAKVDLGRKFVDESDNNFHGCYEFHRFCVAGVWHNFGDANGVPKCVIKIEKYKVWGRDTELSMSGRT